MSLSENNHHVESDESSNPMGLKEKDESQETDIDDEYLQEDEWELKRRVNILFRNCGNEPPNKKALKYLNGASDKYKDYVMVNGPPVRPKAGQVFLYKPRDSPNVKNVVILDQYLWYSSDYSYQTNNFVKKHRYYARNPEKRSYNLNFSRRVYYSTEKKIKDRV